MARIDRSEYPAIAQFVADGMKVPEIAAHFECTPANVYLIVSKIRNGEAGAAAAKLVAKAPAKRAGPSTRKSTVHGGLCAPTAPVAAAIEEGTPAASDSPKPSPDPLARSPVLPQQDPSKRKRRGAAGYAELGLAIVPSQPPNPPSQKPDAQPVTTAFPSSAVEEAMSGSLLTLSPPSPNVTPRVTKAGDIEEAGLSKATGRRSEATPLATPTDRSSRERNARSNGARKRGIGLILRTSNGDEAVHPFRSIEDLLSAVKPLLRSASKSPEPIWFSIQDLDLSELSCE
jgi:hypothetical protein